MSLLSSSRVPTYFLPITLSMLLLTTACSIKDETSEEIKIEQEDKVVDITKLNDVERFIYDCTICISGDLSNLPQLIDTYKSTYTAGTKFSPDSFKYQRIKPTQAFEMCAQKAMLSGDSSAFNAMFTRQARIARVARYFYATNQPVEGAFWLRRLINVRGSLNGYEIAGRIFIQHPKTISIGVQLLEYSARLGNRNASQMLLGLMNPGSMYYHQLTRNAPITVPSLGDNDDSDSEKQDHIKEGESEQSSLVHIDENITTDLLRESSEAVTSSDPELNIPLELYERRETPQLPNTAVDASQKSTQEFEKRAQMLKEVQARANAALEAAKQTKSEHGIVDVDSDSDGSNDNNGSSKSEDDF